MNFASDLLKTMDILDNSLLGKREKKGRRANQPDKIDKGAIDDILGETSDGGRTGGATGVAGGSHGGNVGGLFGGLGTEEDLTIADSGNIDNGDGMDSPPRRPARGRQSGWGADSSVSNNPKSMGTDLFADMNQEPSDERLQRRGNESYIDFDDNNDGDIPVIPNLEEVQEEDMSSKIALAPQVQVNKVATYRDLDQDLLKHSAFTTLDNEIDLKLLAKVLSPESEILEADTSWDWNHLFTEVASELQTEWDKDMGKEEEETGETKAIAA